MKEVNLTSPEIPFLRATFPGKIHDDLAAVFDSGYVGAGELVASFERALEKYLGATSIIATSSCTAALTLAYLDAGVSRAATVLSTPMTCAATNIPLLQLGAKIGWLDVDANSGNVTAETVIDGFNRHPSACAVVIMDWGGVPCDYTSIVAECRRRGIALILDAAQSFGTLHEGQRYPLDVDYVCYSFGPTKFFSTVEGGALATGPHRSNERTKALRWYGIKRESRDPLRFWEYQVEELGYRFVSNNIFAAIGLRSLASIESRLRHHRQLADIYDKELRDIPGLCVGQRLPQSHPNFWLYTILAEERERLLLKLHSHGIHAATPHRRNDRLLAAWNDSSDSENLAGVDKFDRSYVCLPIGPWVQPNDAERMSRLIRLGW
jgi:dTDP-4-amino-4,6-dideoxygalactose transaminase